MPWCLQGWRREKSADATLLGGKGGGGGHEKGKDILKDKTLPTLTQTLPSRKSNVGWSDPKVTDGALHLITTEPSVQTNKLLAKFGQHVVARFR